MCFSCLGMISIASKQRDIAPRKRQISAAVLSLVHTSKPMNREAKGMTQIILIDVITLIAVINHPSRHVRCPAASHACAATLLDCKA